MTYSDIYQIFKNYFLCFNEDIQKIYDYLNKSLVLKRSQLNIQNDSKTIYIESYTLIEGRIQMNKIYIPSCTDSHGLNLVSKKIKEIESLYTIPNSILTVAPLCNYLKYEINSFILYINIYIEKAIESIVFKMRLVEKDSNGNTINKKDDKNEIYSIRLQYKKSHFRFL